MIALVHVDMERRLDAIADVAPIGVADLHLHIAHHRVWDPGDDALQHVLGIELAGRLVLAIVVKPTTRSVLPSPTNSRSVTAAFGSAIAALMKPCGVTQIMNWRTSA